MKRILGALAALICTAAFSATLAPVQLLNPAGSTAGQTVVSNGSGVAPTWQAVPLSGLATQAANTLLANPTGSTAMPVAHAVPSCSAANSALKWTSGSGLSCGTTFALTSGNLSQFAATTSAQLAGVLSDETGSGAIVLGTSPTISTATISGGTVNNASVGATTPSTGKFTTLQATGAITPSTTSGIVGTTAADNASAGAVGEYPTPASASSVSLTNSTNANVTSLVVTAGDWDVCGSIEISPTGTNTGAFGWLTTTSAGNGTGGQRFAAAGATGSGSNVYGGPVPCLRINVSSTTTVYLVGYASFSTGTATAAGYIWARRKR